ncbi:MAG: hypothetical protein V4635_14230 [Bacteroidota bacterium]
MEFLNFNLQAFKIASTPYQGMSVQDKIVRLSPIIVRTHHRLTIAPSEFKQASP